MNKNTLTILLVLVGGAGAYLLAKTDGLHGFDLVFDTAQGLVIGLALGLAVEWKCYYIPAGMLIGLLVSILVDWLAGSEFALSHILYFLLSYGFAGWVLFRGYMRSALLGGTIAIGISFIWGMLQSRWHGTVCIQPGFLNAGLLALEYCAGGMGLSAIFVDGIGRHLVNGDPKVR